LKYAWLAITTPEIVWIGDHREPLKSKLVAPHYDPLHSVDVLSIVIVPKVIITHLIASDLGIQYDEALGSLGDETTWNGRRYAWYLYVCMYIHT
jgi:hypothetical protein